MLAEGILNKNPLALARAISIIENGGKEKREIIEKTNPHTGKAYVIGVTGSPGAGKSSLVNMLTKVIRRKGLTVGVVAVDPTSPFSGGALLGDRIRMQDHLMDDGVFIRSMGTRGNLGGLARTTRDTINLIDAFGMDIILVETVGVGQSELEVIYAVDTVVVVLTPGAGDVVQTLKAGIMEIADIFAVNKADLGGAEKTAHEVESMLDLNLSEGWRPPVIMTTNKDDQGFEDLYRIIKNHRKHLEVNGLLQARQSERFRNEIIDIVLEKIREEITLDLGNSEEYKVLLKQVVERRFDTYYAADKIINSMKGS